MDAALSSDRHHGDNNRRYDNRNNYQGRGRGRGGRYNNTQRHHSRHHPYRRDDYGGGRSNRRDHHGGGYRRDGGRSGGGGRGRDRAPGNRFSTEPKSVDPQVAMMKQLTAMVAKMGDLGGAAEAAGAAESDVGEVRPVVRAIGRNIQDLVGVLCSPSNAGLFLRFGEEATESNANPDDADGMEDSNPNVDTFSTRQLDAATMAGPLATLIHSCATNLPLQTPSYAALTLGVECTAPSSHAGFALRCVELGMKCLGRDLDMMLDCRLVGGKKVGIVHSEQKEEGERCHAERTGGYGNGSQIDAYYRAKFMLRYLAHLSNIGIVSYKQHPNNNESNNLSLMGLLQLLVQCACNAASAATSSHRRASVVLASLVLSTIPYLNMDDANNMIADLLEELETHVVGQSYSSDYEPGVGWQAILLNSKLDDGADEATGEDEDDDDEDDDAPAPLCADTLQDLLRTVRKLTNSSHQNQAYPSRFALLVDAPWKTLKLNVTRTEGMEDVEGSTPEEIVVPMTYTGEPLLLDLVGSDEERHCICVPYLLSLGRGFSNKDSVEVNCHLLDGILYGRLAIFDAPPGPDEDNDDDEGEEGAKESDPNLECYVKSYSLIDRFFLSDAIRDVLMCHRPMVNDAGADRSTAKEVAEQIWMLCHLFHPEPHSEDNEGAISLSNISNDLKGIEYGIVETLLSLIVQSAPRGCNIPASSAVNQHLYLARVLLELTKLKPSLVPRAIVLAISGMFEDFIPSLTPVAQENLATWLAIHLTNTDYQWPKFFWDHWAPYVASGRKRNSRGDFVTMVLHSMAGVSSDGAVVVVKDCLPPHSLLSRSVFLTTAEDSSTSPAEEDIADRFWIASHDPDSIRQFVISDEFTSDLTAIEDENEDHSMFHSSVWWRTGMVTRALLYPISREKTRVARLVDRLSNQADMANRDDPMTSDDLKDEVDHTGDIVADVSDAVFRFKPVILAALARDADAYDSIATGRVEDDQLLLAGEVFILKQFYNIIPSSDPVMYNVMIQSLMKTKIVSPVAVATWALGFNSNSSSRVISPQWWKCVSLAVHSAITSVEGASSDLGGGVGMIIDDTGFNDEDSNETATKRLVETLKITVPVLKCIVEQGCQVLASIDANKNIPIMGADVAEGIKRLFSSVLFLFYHHFSSSPPVGIPELAFSTVLDGLGSMDLSWEKVSLAFQMSMSNCTGVQGKKLLQSLSRSFERMM
ncbi:hypothetical protein ACHAW6_008818 [Cyclotella cf. meneghiniana]